MKTSPLFVLAFLAQLPLVAQTEGTPVPVRERVYIGMVADEQEKGGLLVRAVAPGSPAHKAGVCAGDVVQRVGRQPVSTRSDLRAIVAAGVKGAVLPVEILRHGEPVSLQVVLELRPDAGQLPSRESAALGADRHVRPIQLPEHIRLEIRRHRRLLREQLGALPAGFQPSVVTRELQAIRDLARDAHADRPGWMSGRAGEISVRFRDEEGSVVLYGASNQVSVELYNLEGKLLARYELNTDAERSVLPEPIMLRLQRLR